MDPLSPKTTIAFNNNRLAGLFNYVRVGEVVPHFFTRGSYYLTRNEESQQLVGVTNSCLHRGFKLVTERQMLKPGQPVGCKFHNWSYHKEGELLNSPGTETPKPTCLRQISLTDFGGIFFEANSIRSISELSEMFYSLARNDLNFNDYHFDQENVTFYHCNWQTIMEVYQDTYHNAHVHRNGLSKFLDKDSSWILSQDWSINIAKIAPKTNQVLSFGWSKFDDHVRDVNWDKPWGAISCAVYPGLMLQFFPHTLVVSQLVPISDKMTANYLQIYYDHVVKDNYDFQNAFSDAYSETASEDGPLYDLLEDGRASKYYTNTQISYNELETGVEHFNRWKLRHG